MAREGRVGQRRHDIFCSALQAYQWNFLHTKDEWSRLQISGPLSIDIWAVTSTHGLVPEDRKAEAFHRAGVAASSREGGIEECRIGILEKMLQIRMARIMQNVQAR